MSQTAPAHDLVVFGATSFVGQILVRYLADEFGSRGRLRWAIAGRSRSKLESLRESLGSAAAKLPIVVADAADGPALRAMCESTRVVVSTVGPYALYGEPLVQACAETGTDYCDLTGEPQFIRKMVERYEATARSFVAITGLEGDGGNILTGSQFALQRVTSYARVVENLPGPAEPSPGDRPPAGRHTRSMADPEPRKEWPSCRA